MFNIVLVEPRIPQNTGTIGRVCKATNSVLHLIKPYGFEITDKNLKRAGMDYWYDLDVREWNNLDDFFKSNPLNDRHFFATTKTKKPYFKIKYNKGDFLYFGREDAGLPQELMDKLPNNKITIPMVEGTRSINISISVGIILYDAIRQNF
jgi:tRNA (cytidine/uridine-2'-O-)-methyltransferase